MNDAMEHAAMFVGWLRRNVSEFAAQPKKFLNRKGADRIGAVTSE